jgi:hypothetical protein
MEAYKKQHAHPLAPVCAACRLDNTPVAVLVTDLPRLGVAASDLLPRRSMQVRGRKPTAGSVARLHGGSRRVGERVVRALTCGRDIVAGARAVCRARWRTLERGEGEKRPLLFIAQKVKKGDFTLPENWSSTALFDVRFTGRGADLTIMVTKYTAVQCGKCCH